MVSVSDVRLVALSLPYTTEGFLRDSASSASAGSSTPRGHRTSSGWVSAFRRRSGRAGRRHPVKFAMPATADLRYNWAVVRLAELDRPRWPSCCWMPGMVVSAKRSADLPGHADRGLATHLYG